MQTNEERAVFLLSFEVDFALSSLELRHYCLPAYQVLGVQVCTTNLGSS